MIYAQEVFARSSLLVLTVAPAFAILVWALRRERRRQESERQMPGSGPGAVER